MANAVSQQILVDGPRNTVIKVDGYLDTSDVAATGTLGASASGVTVLGSKVLTFGAGGLSPVVGQYVTGTGIPAGSYIVSVDSTTQVTLNNAATAANTGLTFTLTAGAIVIADPTTLFPIQTGVQSSQVRIDRIIYTVEEGLDVFMYWEATTNVRIVDLVKAGHQEFRKFGGLINNAGTGKTGRVLLGTEGWSSGKILEFTVIVEFVKQP